MNKQYQLKQAQENRAATVRERNRKSGAVYLRHFK